MEKVAPKDQQKKDFERDVDGLLSDFEIDTEEYDSAIDVVDARTLREAIVQMLERAFAAGAASVKL